MPLTNKLQKEVDNNYVFFKKQTFQPHQTGKFALLRNQKIVGILDTRRDALVMGGNQFPDGLYSIQEIQPTIIDLGVHSYAMHSD